MADRAVDYVRRHDPASGGWAYVPDQEPSLDDPEVLVVALAIAGRQAWFQGWVREQGSATAALRALAEHRDRAYRPLYPGQKTHALDMLLGEARAAIRALDAHRAVAGPADG